MMIVPPANRLPLAPFFVKIPHWRCLIDAILEGSFGVAEVDSLDNPQVVLLSVGLFAFYGGNSSHPAARTLAISASQPPFEGRWIESAEPGWGDLFADVHG